MVTLEYLGLPGTLTDRTCGDACWRAREDICKCQCAGARHGCLRSENGVQPPRTRTIKGRRYYFIATMGEDCGGLSFAAYYALDTMAYERNIKERGDFSWQYDVRPVRSMAAPYTLQSWPELKAWRDAGLRPSIVWWPEAYLSWLPGSLRPELLATPSLA